tara:strand:- start:446 stop:718 length:273 start_codon:yes stop_codon:yes gene_type:complete
MSLGKKDICKNINTKALFSSSLSHLFLEKFIYILKNNSNKKIKLPNFGTFYKTSTKARIGRNPKTREIYSIPSRKKLSFHSSNNIKTILN